MVMVKPQDFLAMHLLQKSPRSLFIKVKDCAESVVDERKRDYFSLVLVEVL